MFLFLRTFDLWFYFPVKYLSCFSLKIILALKNELVVCFLLYCYPESFVYLFLKFLVKFTSKQSGPEIFIL